jgi:hypothetical protein
MSIDNIVKNSESYSLSDKELINLTDGQCKVITYQDLEKFNNIDEVLEPFGATVILYQQKEKIGHYTVLIKHSNSLLEIFDSLGLGLDKELEFSEYNKKRHGGRAIPHLSILIENSKYKIEANLIQLQKDGKDINTCGKYCAIRIKFREKSLKDFVKMFKSSKIMDSDMWVSALTLCFV